MILHFEQLVSLNACASQVRLFRITFGDSADITPELCVSVAAKFHWSWAAQNLLTVKARAEYERVRDAARAEYERVRNAARAEYERVRNAARAKYDYVRARAEYVRARAEYERVVDLARAEYERVEAREFGRLFNNQEPQS